ncbi:hypothetical protein HS5_06400 [Acidianus sp. HS-5]|nr:hypothetical protein HS5_06400 [Acidianus sp. HS-5]
MVGENGTGKTSFLEALFLSTLFQSDMSENDINTLFLYAMSSGGDSLSAFSSLSDSTVVLDNNTVTFKKKDSYSLEVDINGEKVTEVNKMELLSEPLFSPSVKVYKKVDNGYFPVYISTFFDRSGNLERIFSIAKRKNRKIKTEFEILQDKYGQFKLYYDLLPAYVIGRGILKREMIKFGLKASNLLLIDEIEDSLHPDMIVQVLKEIREGNTQILLTTHVNEVIKMVNKIFDENEALVLYLTREGYKAYKLSEISEFEMPLSWLGYV